MKKLNRRHFTALAAVSMTAFSALPAAAQASNWPTKPVRLVVGFAPGGGTDILARGLAQELGSALGQNFLVDNRPGGSGSVSVSDVIRSTPDGYTFLVAPTSVETVNPYLFRNNIDAAKDLVPVMGIARMQMYVVARPTLDVKDLNGLIQMAKNQPGRLNYASAGSGTPPHLAGELFKQSTGTNITHVPYRGSGPALQDVVAGHADFVFDPGPAFPHIQAGRVKLLAVASDKRSPFFPDAPTFGDLGIRNASLDIWFGIWAPKNTPADVLQRLSTEVTKALNQASLKQRYNDMGAEPMPLSTAEFRTLLTDEARTLSALIRERNITAE